MIRTNVAAFTPSGGLYPPYISVNYVHSSESEGIEITVRSPRKDDGSCGETVSILLSCDDFRAFVKELAKRSVI